MSRPEGDGPPHVRALTLHDVKRGTARLRTEVELPTLEEFAELCEEVSREETDPGDATADGSVRRE